MIPEFIKRVVKYLQRKGTGILRINVFVARKTTALNQMNPGEGFRLKIINEQVWPDIQKIRGKKKVRQLKEIYKKGAYGLCFYLDSELAAYGWIGVNKQKYAQKIFGIFSIPSNSAHIFDCYTVEKFRGQNLYPSIIFNLVKLGRDKGVDDVYIDAVTDNVAAQKGIGKVGFEPVTMQTKIMILNKILFEYDRKR